MISQFHSINFIFGQSNCFRSQYFFNLIHKCYKAFFKSLATNLRISTAFSYSFKTNIFVQFDNIRINRANHFIQLIIIFINGQNEFSILRSTAHIVVRGNHNTFVRYTTTHISKQEQRETISCKGFKFSSNNTQVITLSSIYTNSIKRNFCKSNHNRIVALGNFSFLTGSFISIQRNFSISISTFIVNSFSLLFTFTIYISYNTNISQSRIWCHNTFTEQTATIINSICSLQQRLAMFSKRDFFTKLFEESITSNIDKVFSTFIRRKTNHLNRGFNSIRYR